MLLAANPDIWRYQPHPEVWLVVLGALALGGYATRVIGPKVVAAGEPIVTRAQTAWYLGGVALLWLASDWPMHDVSEEYLYSVHMIQHMVIAFFVPPMFLKAMPQWLARLIVSEDGSSGVWVRRLAHPVVAGVLFNAVAATTHLPAVVEASVDIGALHYLVHLVVFTTALLMWIPIVSPLPELRISAPAQMIYLFLMSIIPTVPAAWLTLADDPVYDSYDHAVRLWGITVRDDQQMAGLIMKLGGGIYLWSIITVLFFRWAFAQMGRDEPVPTTQLTYDVVTREFDRAGEPAAEPSTPAG
ncbi:MAG: cytochrome c oxidase assembly protein [Acidimicrobiales bacterium]|nr:cytochrome c oxidase assembly protein [Acidimicrobiales bacterium]